MKNTFINKTLLPMFGMLWFSVLITGCVKPTDIHKLSGNAQGTTYHISFWDKKNLDVKAIEQGITTELNRIDTQISNYRSDSAIEQFNATQSEQTQAVSPEIVNLITLARSVSTASKGCYDLTIKPLFELWGFTKDALSIPSEAALQATRSNIGLGLLEQVDESHLRKLKANLRVDLSSIGQGYSVGQISSLLLKNGITNFMVEIGGELQTQGQKPDGQPWRIALEKPISDERTLHKIITIRRTTPLAIMTSGTYRHYFDDKGKRYSHILDGRTGKPISHTTVSVSVLHNDPTMADAWSTALLCLGKTEGLEVANQAGIAALFIEQQGTEFNEFSSDSLSKLEQIDIK